MARLNIRDISIAYAGATVASLSAGAVGSYIWSKFGYDVDYGLVVSSAWLLTVGVPSTMVAAETLRRVLGERQPTTVTTGGGGRGRAIPITANGQTSNIFLSSIPWLKSGAAQPDPDPLPVIFAVSIDGNSYSVTIDELDAFIRGAWKRQRFGDAAFSRPYWTRVHRPRLKPLEYYTRLNVLLACDGLILDRSKRRSGRLSVPPIAAINALQGQFSLV